jgi:hypothetical protein
MIKITRVKHQILDIELYDISVAGESIILCKNDLEELQNFINAELQFGE